jgi:hypothetical protein
MRNRQQAESNAELVMTAAEALTSLTRQTHNDDRREASVGAASPMIEYRMTNHVLQDSAGTQHRSKGPRQKATRFPVKLMQILSSGQHENIISWTPDGLSFVVKKPTLLVSDVLPSYFKEVKYSSFTRKLHRWGFVKILRGKEVSAYFHKNFRRGDFEFCAQMNCKSSPGHSDDVLDHMHVTQNNMSILPRHGYDHDLRVLHSEHHSGEPSAMSTLPIPEIPDRTTHYGNVGGVGGVTSRRPFLQFARSQDNFPIPMNTGPRLTARQDSRFVLNTLLRPSPGAYDLIEARETTQHRNEHNKIMENAWNALNWESKIRASRRPENAFHLHLSHARAP